MRKPFIAGNWKMNTDSQSSVSLARAVAAGCEAIAGKTVDVSVIPPFVYIQAVVKSLNNANITVCEDIYFEENGRFHWRNLRDNVKRYRLYPMFYAGTLNADMF